jgi:hypothetical protein
MSNEIQKTNDSASNSNLGPKFEDKSNSAADSSSIEIAEIGLGLNNKETENEGGYTSDRSETLSEKEQNEENDRRNKLDYAQALKEKMQWDGTCKYSISILPYALSSNWSLRSS